MPIDDSSPSSGPSSANYANLDLTRSEVDATKGTSVLEFGATWCPICQGAQPLILEALAGREWQHIKVEDGPGRPLGRSFQVRLWPTLVFMQNGHEIARVVRPKSMQDLAPALDRLADPAG